MTRPTLIKIWQLGIIGAVLGLSSPPGQAGDGPFNPKDRTFSLSYIYRDLPSTQSLTSSSEADVLSSTGSTLPNDDQKAQITRFWALVSEKLGVVTGNRGTLGQLTEVHNIASADAVISMTGSVRPTYGGAWAQPLGWNNGGTLNLYYNDLVNNDTEDVVETVVHELCHYLFGLPDEYSLDGTLLCPQGTSTTCCLMDNYHHRWNGRLCTGADHNALAPGANRLTPAIADHSLSCQDIVDNFFKQYTLGAVPALKPLTVKPPRRFARLSTTNRSKVLVNAKQILAKLIKEGKAITTEIRNDLTAAVANDLLKTGSNDLLGLVPGLVDDLIFKQLGAPIILKPIADVLEKHALDLARSIIDPNGKAAAIETKLFALFKNQVDAGKLGASPTFGDDVPKYISSLAQSAAEGNLAIPIADRPLGNRAKRRSTVIIEPPILVFNPGTVGLDDVVTQASSTSNYNDLRKQNGLSFARLVNLDRINALSATSSGDDSKGITVGLHPLDSRQTRNVFSLDTDEGKGTSNDPKNKQNLANEVFKVREGRLDQILELVRDQIAQEKLENIVVLIPPGGLTDHFNSGFEKLAAAFIGKADLRLDIAVVGSSPIPARLRDFVVRTNGSILTVTDSDEVGAVAQRLAGAQTQGTWISVPQQDMLTFNGYRPVPAKTPAAPVEMDKKGEDACGVEFAPPLPQAKVEREPVPPLFERLERNRKPHQVTTSLEKLTRLSKVVLQPFYLDTKSDYEFILGLTQPISVADLSVFEVDNKKTVTLSSTLSPNFVDPVLNLFAGQIQGSAIKTYEDSKELPSFSWTPNLKLDKEKSTASTLVFRLPAATLGGVAAGWYTPVLTLDGSNFRKPELKNGVNEPSDNLIVPEDKKIHFTFSVGSPKTTGQLVANLVQDLPNTPDVQGHGTIGRDKQKAVISAVLSAGSGVIDAEVKGFLQKIDLGGTGDILSYPVDFNDDGLGDDKVDDDGIYTAVISLEEKRATTAEFRVFIDARSIKGTSRFVPVGEPSPIEPGDKPDVSASNVSANPTAPGFQRATSINFFVPANVDR